MNKSEIKEIYAKYGIAGICEQLLPYFNIENYGRIDINLNKIVIDRVPILNIIEALNKLEMLTGVENKDYYFEMIFEKIETLIDKKNYLRIKPPKRKSHLQIDNICKNFFKTMIKGECQYAYEFGNELYMRDSKLFFELLFQAALLNLGSKTKAGYYSETGKKAAAANSAKYLLDILGKAGNYYYVLSSVITFVASTPNDFSLYDEISAEKRENTVYSVEQLVETLKKRGINGEIAGGKYFECQGYLNLLKKYQNYSSEKTPVFIKMAEEYLKLPEENNSQNEALKEEMAELIKFTEEKDLYKRFSSGRIEDINVLIPALIY